jgi:hypothetical protein
MNINKITTKEGMITHLSRVSREYEHLPYKFRGSVADYIKYALYKWNKHQASKADQIKAYELNIGCIDDYKSCYFQSQKKAEELENQRIAECLRESIMGRSSF